MPSASGMSSPDRRAGKGSDYAPQADQKAEAVAQVPNHQGEVRQNPLTFNQTSDEETPPKGAGGGSFIQPTYNIECEIAQTVF